MTVPTAGADRMIGTPRGNPAGPGPRDRRRTLVRSGASLLLPPALTATLALAIPSAAAASGPTVALPVMSARLADDAACTKASTTTAAATPWEHRSLELSRAARISSGAGVKVGVVDTGVATNAPTLAGRVEAVGQGGTDCVGHGTFVAGLPGPKPRRTPW
ncbi:hypothetical protein [Streptomyces sp. NPDC002690]